LRILVSGSRNWRYPATIRRVLDETVTAHIADDRCPNVTVIHGGAPGADRIAGDYAQSRGWNVEVHHADWATCAPGCSKSERHRRVGKRGEYCPTAGHRRNASMVDSRPDIVVAFWRDHSAGTSNCLDLAKAAGLLIDPYLDCACHPVGQPATF
jgi:YspA, cpYpsA-related SLOG family